MFEPGSSFSSVINARVIGLLSKRIVQLAPAFDQKAFEKRCQVEGLKFGARITLVREALQALMPFDLKKNCEILVNALPPQIPEDDAGVSYWDHFIVMPMADYVMMEALKKPLSKKDLVFYLDILKEMTKSFSSEGAVRPFIEQYPEETMKYLLKCTKDDNAHVRRWASEGSRPRLPLAAPLRQFKKNPTPVIEILERLKDDEHDYVYRSVANNLNDIAKDNPKIVTDLLLQWKVGAGKTRQWVIRHALRTLIKKGDKAAFRIIGIKNHKFKLSKVGHPARLKKGEDLLFEFEVTNHSMTGTFVVDFVIEFKKKKGSSRKTFKHSKIELLKNETRKLQGKMAMRDFSTRKVLAGEHAIAIQINGQCGPFSHFILIES